MIGPNKLILSDISFLANSWWIVLIISAILALALYFFIRSRTELLNRQNEALEDTVRIRTLELKEQKERAEQSERYKEQFLANMSHEIRTPMHAISGMTNILLRNEHHEHQQKYLKAIQESSVNLLVILNDILNLSKLEAGKIEIEYLPTNPRKVIASVVELLKLKADEKGVNFDFSIDQALPEYISTDPTRLSQILINLLGNAFKFTEQGGVELKLEVIKNEIQFTVKDTGIGIPSHKMDTIFMSFEQVNESTTRKYGGTGLGLSITRQLIEMQGGRIWVESEEGKGSQFSFVLPLNPVKLEESDEENLNEKQLKSMSDALSGLKILLVEDVEFNAMIAIDDLKYYLPDVKLDHALNGKIAVEMFQSTDYDLVLMDLQMPEMDGFEAAQIIRKMESETEKRTPIIAMTASLLTQEIENCFKSGMDNYIPKPYKPFELIGAIYEEMKRPESRR